jgi:outer membrane protein assembly factor BamA
LILFLVALLIPSPGLTQEEEIDEVEKQIELWSRIEAFFEGQQERGFIVLPIAFFNPTIGSATGAAARYLYRLDDGSTSSHTTLGAAWAGEDGWVAGLWQKTFFDADRYKVDGEFGLFDVSRSYYGIGFDSGKAGDFIDLYQSGALFNTRAMLKTGQYLYLGARFRLLTMETTSDDPDDLDSGQFSIPPEERDAVSSGMGLTLLLDSRDNQYSPYSGSLLELTSYAANEAFGSDFDYRNLRGDFKGFLEVSPDQVLALAVSGCFSSGDVPYYDLCSYGQRSNLRGYVSGRYRDKNMLSAQMEYRGRFYDRWGLVAFVGTGKVAPDVDGFGEVAALPSAGGGVRLLVSRSQRINVGIDYAVGRDEKAWYLRFGEAF